MDSAAEDRHELVRQCQSFLDPDQYGPYMHALEKDVLTADNIQNRRLRLEIDIGDVQTFRRSLHHRFVTDPSAVIRAFGTAVESVVSGSFPEVGLDENQIQIGVVGELGPNTVSPRDLTSAFIFQLVRVEGVAVKVADPQTWLSKSVQYCEKTGHFMMKDYPDAISYDILPTNAVYPQYDDQGNPLTTELGQCKFTNRQFVTLQQLPEDAPVGQLPSSTTVMYALLLLMCWLCNPLTIPAFVPAADSCMHMKVLVLCRFYLRMTCWMHAYLEAASVWLASTSLKCRRQLAQSAATRGHCCWPTQSGLCLMKLHLE